MNSGLVNYTRATRNPLKFLQYWKETTLTQKFCFLVAMLLVLGGVAFYCSTALLLIEFFWIDANSKLIGYAVCLSLIAAILRSIAKIIEPHWYGKIQQWD